MSVFAGGTKGGLLGVDDTMKLVEQRAHLFGTDAGKELRKEGKLTAKELIRAFPPTARGLGGTWAEQKRIGTAALARDVSRVYIGASSVAGMLRDAGGKNTARAYLALLRSGKQSIAGKLLRRFGGETAKLAGVPVARFDGGAAHRRRRSSRTGRVTKSRHAAIVTDTRALREYEKNKREDLGRVKGGWVLAARRLGATGIPAWIARHARGGGFREGDGKSRGRIKDSGFVQLVNRVPYAKSSARRKAVVEHVFRVRRGKLHRQMSHAARKRFSGKV